MEFYKSTSDMTEISHTKSSMDIFNMALGSS